MLVKIGQTRKKHTDNGCEEVADIDKCKTLCRSIDDRKNKCVGEIATQDLGEKVLESLFNIFVS